VTFVITGDLTVSISIHSSDVQVLPEVWVILEKGVYYFGVKLCNMHPYYIKTQSLVILKNLKWFYKEFYVKILFIPWINILNLKKF